MTDRLYFSGTTGVLGVFGHPIAHSLSPSMHNAAIEALGLDYVYVPFDVAPENLRQALEGVRALGIAGVNVTIPHKSAVIPYLDEVEEDAREIGSVNTISNMGGRLVGASTDGPGFLRSLAETGFAPRGSRVVVLGAGGAGRAVTFALAKTGAHVVVLDEAQGKAEQLAVEVARVAGEDCARAEPVLARLAEHLRDAELLVNCTPVGMHPRDDRMPVPAELLRPDLLVYDLIYNPIKTKLLTAAAAVGACTMNGVKMLVYQGAVSFRIWTGKEPPVPVMEAAVVERL